MEKIVRLFLVFVILAWFVAVVWGIVGIFPFGAIGFLVIGAIAVLFIRSERKPQNGN